MTESLDHKDGPCHFHSDSMEINKNSIIKEIHSEAILYFYRDIPSNILTQWLHFPVSLVRLWAGTTVLVLEVVIHPSYSTAELHLCIFNSTKWALIGL